ncbi:hypothetical protein [Spirochaeta cellobiosiphila]|uniref:hypothetical protein n=1 Tax=Spirochaeta cellobiosiphila TaxID=504483 RepID=UPI0003F57941|nr:hypothetical protein [Spirochaeta cellobiosiphila]
MKKFLLFSLLVAFVASFAIAQTEVSGELKFGYASDFDGEVTKGLKDDYSKADVKITVANELNDFTSIEATIKADSGFMAVDSAWLQTDIGSSLGVLPVVAKIGKFDARGERFGKVSGFEAEAVDVKLGGDSAKANYQVDVKPAEVFNVRVITDFKSVKDGFMYFTALGYGSAADANYELGFNTNGTKDATSTFFATANYEYATDAFSVKPGVNFSYKALGVGDTEISGVKHTYDGGNEIFFGLGVNAAVSDLTLTSGMNFVSVNREKWDNGSDANKYSQVQNLTASVAYNLFEGLFQPYVGVDFALGTNEDSYNKDAKAFQFLEAGAQSEVSGVTFTYGYAYIAKKDDSATYAKQSLNAPIDMVAAENDKAANAFFLSAKVSF